MLSKNLHNGLLLNYFENYIIHIIYVYTQVVDNRRIITSFFLEHNEPLLTGLLIG